MFLTSWYSSQTKVRKGPLDAPLALKTSLLTFELDEEAKQMISLDRQQGSYINLTAKHGTWVCAKLPGVPS